MPKRQRQYSLSPVWEWVAIRTEAPLRIPTFISPTVLKSNRLRPSAVSQNRQKTPDSLQMSAGKCKTQIVAAVLSGLLLFPHSGLALTEPQKLVAEAWRIVDQSFVDRTFNHKDWFQTRMRAVKKSYGSMEEAYKAIRDMLALLEDPYTRFLTPPEYISLTSSTTGEVAGVGVEMFPTRVDNNLKVTAPIDDSPAERAGVRPSDVIKFIDGEDTSSLTPDEAAARIRGRPGSIVTLTVVHDGGNGKEESFNLTRVNLKLKSVKSSMPKPRELYIKIKQFSSSTADDLKAALEEYNNKEIDRIILDLRNNSGGYFPGGVDVARLFLKAGTPIVYVMDKSGVADEIDNAYDGMLTDVPMCILVNSGTASASEILAGALKDNGRARLVGEQTFGKGVVQTVSQLSNGSGIAVTVARYETPNHININKVGIAPDFKRECSLDADVHTCLPPNF
ncbi:Peptidase S41 [Gracilaria domingensis]|nr:Peptidase S41 [Gracilaria domingensis]